MRHCVLCGCNLNSTKRSAYHVDCLRDYKNLIKRLRSRHSKPKKSEVKYAVEEIERGIEWALRRPAREVDALGPDAERLLLDLATRTRYLCRLKD